MLHRLNQARPCLLLLEVQGPLGYSSGNSRDSDDGLGGGDYEDGSLLGHLSILLSHRHTWVGM